MSRPVRLQARMLSDGRRLHLSDGPIDLIIGADGPSDRPAVAFQAAIRRMHSLLDELCAELPILRRASATGTRGAVARRMQQAIQPFLSEVFVTPMAAVAGAVAEAVLHAMLEAAPNLDRAYVNNGGDIALHLARSATYTLGIVDRPDRPTIVATARLKSSDGISGIATSGWRGRSFSFGIADACTVLASSAADADVAATMIANAVDLPDHPAIRRTACSLLDPASDLGDRLVTECVGRLIMKEVEHALDAGARYARILLKEQRIAGAVLCLAGRSRVIGFETKAAGLPAARTSSLQIRRLPVHALP